MSGGSFRISQFRQNLVLWDYKKERRWWFWSFSTQEMVLWLVILYFSWFRFRGAFKFVVGFSFMDAGKILPLFFFYSFDVVKRMSRRFYTLNWTWKRNKLFHMWWLNVSDMRSGSACALHWENRWHGYKCTRSSLVCVKVMDVYVLI